jgi:hypothetical protein
MYIVSSKLAQAEILPTCIREISCLHLCPGNDPPWRGEGVRNFSQSSLVYAGIVPQLGQNCFFPHSFPLHYSLIALPFGAIYPALQLGQLNYLLTYLGS